ncbi:MAG: methylated-DNA--[protein]-cysteine S-methyltransferase [Candidatus Gastranaerophilales bacterium]|nr:methylated-DNA--[protein]-cysteine S-methyltransferase [Candidatus Gastranaerophilales bacterium]
MDKLYYNEFHHKQTGIITLASFRDDLVFIGINSHQLCDFASRINLKAFKDTASNKIAIEQLKEYFNKERKVFDLKTKFLTGTAFQQKVWNELKNIPYGKVISYKELAKRIQSPNAFRATGNANSKNPIPVIFPCHRVINSNGDPGGFSCGIELKKYLLSLEY